MSLGSAASDATFRLQRSLAVSKNAVMVGLESITPRVDGGRVTLELVFLPSAVDSKSALPPLGLANVSIRRVEGFGPRLQVLRILWPKDHRQTGASGPTRLGLLLDDVDPKAVAASDAVYELALRRLPVVDGFFDRALFRLSPPSSVQPSDEGGAPAETRLEAPAFTYLAKDFNSFRGLMLDQMARTVADWTERNPVDLGVALVEVLAYAADFQSYQQDAVATEAYLETARRRVSVGRHVRLVDYRLGEGCNARAWVQIQVHGPETDEKAKNEAKDEAARGAPVEVPRGTRILSGGPDPGVVSPGSREWALAIESGARVFETVQTVTCRAAHNRLELYDWGAERYQLPAGATRATLAGHHPDLALGDVLVLAQTVDPQTGLSLENNPRRAYAVRLVRPPEAGTDRLDGHPVTEIVWDSGDALPEALPVTRRSGGKVVRGISSAYGNVVLADHGMTVVERLPTVPALGAYTPVLWRQQITWRTPVPEIAGRLEPASQSLEQRVDETLPDVVLFQIDERYFHPRGDASTDGAGDGEPATTTATTTTASDDVSPDLSSARMNRLTTRARTPSPRGGRSGDRPAFPESFDAHQRLLASMLDHRAVRWYPRRDLLSSDPFDPHFVVEVTNDGTACLRFGDGQHGTRPAPLSRFFAIYRVGNGSDGNVGSRALTQVVTDDPRIAGCDNFVAASGGLSAESLEHARLAAPQSFWSQERCVSTEDFDTVTERAPGVSAARTRLTWTGSRRLAEVHVLLEDGRPVDDETRRRLDAWLAPHLLATREAVIRDPRWVPLEIVLAVGLDAGSVRDLVRRRLEAAYFAPASAGGGEDGRGSSDGGGGLFAPGRWGFGQPVDLGPVVETALGVSGVSTVEPLVFRRLSGADDGLATGRLAMGPLEVMSIRAGASPWGTLELLLGGGQ